MNFVNILIIGIGLAADASAVISAKATSFKTNVKKKIIVLAISFAFFQALMPIIGYFIGISLIKLINSFSNILAFIILVLIGLNMIKEAKVNDLEDKEEKDVFLSFKSILALSIATSIDALICGISFIALDVNIFYAALIIFLSTLFCCLISAYFGKLLGDKFGEKAEIAGGIILILIGIKILLSK